MKTKLPILTLLVWVGALATSLAGPAIVTQPKLQTNAGGYSVVVTNLAGTTNREARLSVYENQFERVTQPGWTNESCNSSGLAWGDYDGDGYQDLIVCNAALSWDPYVIFLYHNNGSNTGAGPFTRMTSNEVGDLATDLGIWTGAAWIDLNHDGRLDLYVSRIPKNAVAAPVAHRLYINQGNGQLASVSAGALTAPRFASGASWGDFDNDGWLDAHCLSAWNWPGGWPVIRTNQLFKGKPDGTFERISDSVIVTSQADSSNYDAWGDYDNDGDLDLVVVNLNSRSFFFQNQGGSRFSWAIDVVSSTTTPLYNAAWGDYDNDGDLDLVITGYPCLLFRNEFPDDFVPLSLADASVAYPAWADYDNDGFLDLMLFTGQGAPAQGRLLRNNGDGTFSDVTPPTPFGRWPWGAWGDYDNDGSMDLFASSDIGENALFHNKGNTNHWIKFNLKGTVANGAAIGAKVRVQATIGGRTMWQMREIWSGAFFQADLRPNFGLGDATRVETVRVEWPSGHVTEITNVAANQILTIQEPPGVRVGRPEHGVIPISITGHIGERYDVKVSRDITAPSNSWVLWQTVTNTMRTITLSAPISAAETNRFYKATPTPTNIVIESTPRVGDAVVPDPARSAHR